MSCTTLREAAAAREVLAPALALPIPAALRLTNLEESRPDFARHMRDAVYAPRLAMADAVELVRLPPGSLVHAGSSDILSCGGAVVRETFPPYAGEDVGRFLAHMVHPGRPRLALPGECLLLSRWGHATWGHWLGELMPRLALAEAAHPGRFTYVLPAAFATGALRSQAESLRLHGVPPGRWLTLRPGHDHAFAALHAVTPAWTGMVLHPAAGQALRRAVPHRPGPARRVALLREAASGRTLLNVTEVMEHLARRGFAAHQPGAMGYAAQVALFQGAWTVFGVLGSDLTGLLHAPAGVAVLAAAPDSFGDDFFHALVTDRRGTMADLRGPAEGEAPHPHRQSFRLDPALLDRALDVMGC